MIKSRMRQTISPNIALVGCGAISQAFYLPALKALRASLGRLWLVDPSSRARATALGLLDGTEASSLKEIPDEVQVAIIATPNDLHVPLACEALDRGCNVLLEKPFAIWPDEARDLITAAAAANRVAAVNQTRRLFPVTQELRARIQSGEFGLLQSVVHREGTKLTWPFESGAGFVRGAQRTGVIMDFGVHVLDFYHYLLNPMWTLKSAIHDGFQGPEGLAMIELRANDAPVSIRLSRYQAQENVGRLEFEKANISFNVYDTSAYVVHERGAKASVRVTQREPAGTAAERLLENFLAACDGKEPPVCDASSSLPVILVLDEIYRNANHYSAAIGAV